MASAGLPKFRCQVKKSKPSVRPSSLKSAWSVECWVAERSRRDSNASTRSERSLLFFLARLFLFLFELRRFPSECHATVLLPHPDVNSINYKGIEFKIAQGCFLLLISARWLNMVIRHQIACGNNNHSVLLTFNILPEREDFPENSGKNPVSFEITPPTGVKALEVFRELPWQNGRKHVVFDKSLVCRTRNSRNS